MKKNLKKGFTLVELLVVIVLLGVIGAIVIYNMTSVGTSSKETDYKRFTSTVKSAAKSYANLNEEAFNELYVNKAYIYIKAGQLIDDGLLDEKLKNPYTNKTVGREELIKASLDTTNGNVVFEYPVKDSDKNQESYLVAMSDYVVWGEPYDCMRGAGTYELALADENGDLILLNDETIKEYNFTCTFPSEFQTPSNITAADGSLYDFSKLLNYKSTNKAGNYEIEYNWITKSGTRKKTTRNLRVEAQVQPSLEFNDPNYDFKKGDAADFYENKYVVKDECKTNGGVSGDVTNYAACGKWDTLQFKPYIEGADMNKTTFGIFKKTNGGYGSTATAYKSLYTTAPTVNADTAITTVTADNNKKFTEAGYLMSSETFENQVGKKSRDDYNADKGLLNTENSMNNYGYIADEGDKNYLISTRVRGHYFDDYYYDMVKEYTVRVELKIPVELIKGDDTNNIDRLDHIYHIVYGTFNKSGIAYYEYRLTNDNVAPSKTASIVDVNRFNVDVASINLPNNEAYNAAKRVDGNRKRHVYVSSLSQNGSCPANVNTQCSAEDIDKNYNYIFFRAINTEGYVGEWTGFATKLSNSAKTLVNARSMGITNVRYYNNAHVYNSMSFIVLGTNGYGVETTTASTTGYICPSYTRTWTQTFQTEDRTWTETFSQTISSIDGVIREPGSYLEREHYSYNKLAWRPYSGITGYGGPLTYARDNLNYWLPQIAYSGNNSYVYSSYGGLSYAGGCLPGRGVYTLNNNARVCCVSGNTAYIA